MISVYNLHYVIEQFENIITEQKQVGILKRI